MTKTNNTNTNNNIVKEILSSEAAKSDNKNSILQKSLPFSSPKLKTGLDNNNSSSYKESTASDLLQGMLWVDKHMPKSSVEMVGSNELLKKLSEWLKRWDSIHLKHTLKIPYSKENPAAKVFC
jgi:hypothetical protein